MWQIIGQDRAVAMLQRSLERGVSHAFLFTGPEHVGKMTLAIELARALNCAAAQPPCGECPTCRRIGAGQYADVRVIDLNAEPAESRSRTEISIEQVRDMQHAASLPPFEGRCKVFIINQAELLSTEAANCLLKTLEEPADKVVFVLLAQSESSLPPTVVSRCQKVELRPAALNDLEAGLVGRLDLEPTRARLLARLANGCPGWAVAAVRDSALLQQRARYIEELFGLNEADMAERFAVAGRWANQFTQDRNAVTDKLALWTDLWRDVLLINAGCAASATNIDQLGILTKMARNYSMPQIKDFIEGIRSAGIQLRQNANARLALEVLMLAIPVPGGES